MYRNGRRKGSPRQTNNSLKKKLKKRVNNISRACWVNTAIGIESELRLLTKRKIYKAKKGSIAKLYIGVVNRCARTRSGEGKWAGRQAGLQSQCLVYSAKPWKAWLAARNRTLGVSPLHYSISERN